MTPDRIVDMWKNGWTHLSTSCYPGSKDQDALMEAEGKIRLSVGIAINNYINPENYLPGDSGEEDSDEDSDSEDDEDDIIADAEDIIADASDDAESDQL